MFLPSCHLFICAQRKMSLTSTLAWAVFVLRERSNSPWIEYSPLLTSMEQSRALSLLATVWCQVIALICAADYVGLVFTFNWKVAFHSKLVGTKQPFWAGVATLFSGNSFEDILDIIVGLNWSICSVLMCTFRPVVKAVTFLLLWVFSSMLAVISWTAFTMKLDFQTSCIFILLEHMLI